MVILKDLHSVLNDVLLTFNVSLQLSLFLISNAVFSNGNIATSRYDLVMLLQSMLNFVSLTSRWKIYDPFPIFTLARFPMI